jgi:phage terminase large subunit-like protein
VSRSSKPSGVTLRLDGWPPRWLSPLLAADAKRGDGEHAGDWIEAFCRITKDSIAGATGEQLALRGWQRQILNHLLARRPDGRFRHRQGLVGLARKNGKSSLSAGLALYGLLSDYPGGPQGREVYSCAGDRDQARIVFGTAKRMIELEPELAGVTRLYRDAIEVPETGSVYRVLSAEAYTKEGLNPTLVVFDEVHVQPSRELWDVMALAAGARPEPLMVGITTAGVRYDTQGRDSLCYQLYEYGRQVASGEVEDASFCFAWWEPKVAEADHLDPATWLEANPGFGDLVSEEDFRATAQRTPESEFRTKRCNQFVTTAEAWLPHGSWEACAALKGIPDGSSVCLGFDGSFNNDATAVVVAEVAEKPHLDVVELWEAPAQLEQEWRVPVIEVEDVIRAACKRWQVLEIACDPYRWTRSYQILEAEGLPVAEFPQSPARMTPATQHFYEAVINKQLTHSGDARLARHVGNAVLKSDSRGMRIYKEHRNSSRRIDLAVASLMAFERAHWHSQQGYFGVRYGRDP